MNEKELTQSEMQENMNFYLGERIYN